LLSETNSSKIKNSIAIYIRVTSPPDIKINPRAITPIQSVEFYNLFFQKKILFWVFSFIYAFTFKFEIKINTNRQFSNSRILCRKMST
jgi:hypothetical protein